MKIPNDCIRFADIKNHFLFSYHSSGKTFRQNGLTCRLVIYIYIYTFIHVHIHESIDKSIQNPTENVTTENSLTGFQERFEKKTLNSF